MSFFISMFIDDMAVVAMMIPLVLGLLKTVGAKPGSSNFGKAMMMAIIFGTVLGGICTPAGVSSNIIALAFLNKNANMHVSFLYWTVIATPICVVIAAITWWLILRIFPPEIKQPSLRPGRSATRIKGAGTMEHQREDDHCRLPGRRCLVVDQ